MKIRTSFNIETWDVQPSQQQEISNSPMTVFPIQDDLANNMFALFFRNPETSLWFAYALTGKFGTMGGQQKITNFSRCTL